MDSAKDVNIILVMGCGAASVFMICVIRHVSEYYLATSFARLKGTKNGKRRTKHLLKFAKSCECLTLSLDN